MKLLSKDLLLEYGFSFDVSKSSLRTEVMVNDGFTIFIRQDGTFYYSNVGIDYPLRDIAGLKKLFKEVRQKDLKAK